MRQAGNLLWVAMVMLCPLAVGGEQLPTVPEGRGTSAQWTIVDELERKQAAERLLSLKTEIKALSDLQKGVADQKSSLDGCLAGLKPKEKLDSLQKAVQNVQDRWKTSTSLRANDPQLRQLTAALDAAIEVPDRLADGARRNIQSLPGLRILPLNVRMGRYSDTGREASEGKPEGGIASLRDLRGFISDSDRGEIKKGELDELGPYLQKVAEILNDSAKRDALGAALAQDAKKAGEDYLKAISDEVTKKLDADQSEQKQLEPRVAELDKKLRESQQVAAGRIETDRNLVYAIWMLIGALVLLLVIVCVFPTANAREMIKERTLVELVSMAFLLLTIIILGTGLKISGETLGTLLGTIAGYLFGRRLQEGEKATRQEQAGGQQPKPTEQPGG